MSKEIYNIEISTFPPQDISTYVDLRANEQFRKCVLGCQAIAYCTSEYDKKRLRGGLFATTIQNVCDNFFALQYSYIMIFLSFAVRIDPRCSRV